jgi:hypothetical protein
MGSDVWKQEALPFLHLQGFLLHRMEKGLAEWFKHRVPA